MPAVYSIDGRGRKLLDKVGVAHLLPEYGVQKTAIDVARVSTDGTVKRSVFAGVDATRIFHFLPRKSLIKVCRLAGNKVLDSWYASYGAHGPGVLGRLAENQGPLASLM